MEEIIDFTNCKRIFRALGGTDRKFEVEYNGNPYIIKFSDKHAKKTDMSTSYINNVVSEYICSHISESMGLPTHKKYFQPIEDTTCQSRLNKTQNHHQSQGSDLLRQ